MDRHGRQAQYLEQVAAAEIRNVEMSPQEREEKQTFRLALEKLCHDVCAANPERIPKISLEPFGSFQSGFASAGSDMDLVIVVKDNSSSSACFSLLEDDLPRALEKKLLQVGYGT
jgi:terminal uridylyltransferase